MTSNQLQNRYTSHPIKLNICAIQSPSSNILILSDIYCILLDICCILLRYLHHDPFRYLPNPFRYLPHPIRYLNIDLSKQIPVSFCQIYNMPNPTRYLLHPIKSPAHTSQYYLSFEILKLSVVYWFFANGLNINIYATYCTYFLPYFSKITVYVLRKVYLTKNEIQMRKKITKNLHKINFNVLL